MAILVVYVYVAASFDYRLLPVKEYDQFESVNVEPQPANWSLCLNDGYVTALENYLFIVSCFFCAMRCRDFIKLSDEYDRIMQWRYFWEFCEK